MLDDIPQAYMACTCLALRPKKEPGDSNRDISGLIDGGCYTSEARSWGAGHGRQDTVAVFAPQLGNRELSVTEELISGGLISNQGNQQRG